MLFVLIYALVSLDLKAENQTNFSGRPQLMFIWTLNKGPSFGERELAAQGWFRCQSAYGIDLLCSFLPGYLWDASASFYWAQLRVEDAQGKPQSRAAPTKYCDECVCSDTTAVTQIQWPPRYLELAWRVWGSWEEFFFLLLSSTCSTAKLTVIGKWPRIILFASDDVLYANQKTFSGSHHTLALP